jgi:hypothetical protein
MVFGKWEREDVNLRPRCHENRCSILIEVRKNSWTFEAGLYRREFVKTALMVPLILE